MYGTHTEIYEMIMKDITVNLNKWRDKPCSWVRWPNMVKISILSKFLWKSQQAVFYRYRQAYSKIFMKDKRIGVAKITLERRMEGEVLHYLRLRLIILLQ